MTVEIKPSGQKLELYRDGIHIGSVKATVNPFHSRCHLLDFGLKIYDNAACELFRSLNMYFGTPLQANLSSEDHELADFLLSGGFLRLRRSVEVSVEKSDLLPGNYGAVSLRQTVKGQAEYLAFGRRLYEYYRSTHEKISPLTASFSDFCEKLPGKIISGADGLHFAYVDADEIAYICSDDPETIGAFGYALASDMFGYHKSICFECDDCDRAAMAFRRLFKFKKYVSWDTYIYR